MLITPLPMYMIHLYLSCNMIKKYHSYPKRLLEASILKSFSLCRDGQGNEGNCRKVIKWKGRTC